MISELFKTSEVVKVLDFLLDDPLSQHLKKDLAEGAGISRPTLDKIVPELLKLGILKKVRTSGLATIYEMDIESPLVVNMIKFNAEIGKVFATKNIDKLDVSKDYETYPEISYMPQYSQLKLNQEPSLKNIWKHLFMMSTSDTSDTEYLEVETKPNFSEA